MPLEMQRQTANAAPLIFLTWQGGQQRHRLIVFLGGHRIREGNVGRGAKSPVPQVAFFEVAFRRPAMLKVDLF